jgi:predicted dehydrogenase
MEKPFCMTVKEADAMIRAARRNKVMLTVSHNRRWDLDYVLVKKQVDAGLLGTPFLIESRVQHWGPPRGWRALRKFGGSILYDWGAHLVDQVLQMRKYPKVESVYGDFQYRVWNSEVENNARATIRFKDKTMAMVEISQTVQLQAPRWFIMGDKGTLCQEAQYAFTATGAKIRTQIGGMTATVTPEPIKTDVADFYRNVAAHLKHGVELIVKPEEARASTAIIEAARKSAKTGQVVKF